MGAIWALWIALPAQSPTPLPVIELGATRSAELPLVVQDGRNSARQRFKLEFKTATRFSVRVSSLDFQPLLELHAQPGDRLVGTGTRAIWNDALLAADAQPGAAYEIEIGSMEPRGGTCTLTAEANEAAVPSGQALTLAKIEACEAIARRAKEKGEGQRAAKYWLQAGEIGQREGQYAAARRALGSCIEEARPSKEDAYVLEARLLLALCSGLERKYAECVTLLRALQSEVEAQPERMQAGSLGQIRALQHVAMLHEGLADALVRLEGRRAAIPDLRKCADVAGQVDEAAARQGWGRPMEILALPKLAMALDEIGNANEADQVLDKCDAAARKDPKDLVMTAAARLARARIEGMRGASRAARDHALEALEIADKSTETKPSMRADILGTLARAQIDLAQYEEALSNLDELAQLVDLAPLPELAPALHRVRAVLFHELYDPARARAELEKALECTRALGNEDGLGECWMDLALVAREEGKAEEAEQLLEKAIAQAQALGDLRLEAMATFDSGLLLEDRLDLDCAAAAYQRTADLGATVADQFLGALAENGLGYVAHLSGDAESAEAHSIAAVRGFEALGMLEPALEARDTLARVALARGNASALRAEIDRAQELLAQGEPRRLDPFQRASHRAHFAEWGALQQSLVSLSLARKEQSDESRAAVREQGLEEASHWKGRILLESLAQGMSVEEIGESLDAGGRAKWLPANAALLEYVESVDRLLVYVVQKERIDRIDLGERASLAKEAQEFSSAIAQQVGDSQALAAASHELWKHLLEPIRPYLPQGIRTLVVVPAPPLARLPFEALVSDPKPSPEPLAGEPRCVIDDYLVCYAPATTLLPLLEQRPSRSGPERQLLVGDAVYAGDQAQSGAPATRSADPEFARLPRLRKSRAEVLEIARDLLRADPQADAAAWKQVNEKEKEGDLALSGKGFDLYVGRPATAALLRRDLSQYSELHLALHACIHLEDPRRSALVFSCTDSELGLFTLEEAWKAHLDANLVVLSACESAGGKVLGGEGVQSLANAFVHAGARAVAATLWVVDDDDARNIMELFKAQLRTKGGSNPARALREARQEYRRAKVAKRGRGVSTGFVWQPWQWATWICIGAPPR